MTAVDRHASQAFSQRHEVIASAGRLLALVAAASMDDSVVLWKYGLLLLSRGRCNLADVLERKTWDEHREDARGSLLS